ncbi:MAG: extracellular solute-binding protein family 5 [Solirubrobacterales bacterium]|jgi:peptide/nickel transport system substrate-binding protein|nr:extracellular solute-binding protein family 5 [Solirubrobacterales bacterium]
MYKPLRRILLLGVFAAAAMLVLAACGGKSKKSSTASSSGSATTAAPSGQQKGGTLKVLSNEDFDNIDPGQAYFQLTYEWLNAAVRPLMSFKPDNATQEVPDLAAAAPTVAPDGKTVTVKIKPNIKFGPPVNRVVTSTDVKYAIERGFTKQVPTGYIGAYFGVVEGAPTTPGNYKPISGIQTPDKTTIVFKLTKPTGGQLAQALVLPITAPVPKEFAQKYDAKTPSTYGLHQVATGPYMVKRLGTGPDAKVDYRPGKGITLVRNPNWDPSTDYRPAYVDQIDWSIGNDPAVAGNQILTGSSSISGDSPPAPIVKKAAQQFKDQISFTPLGSRYIAFNTKIPPFNNINLRKAVSAATDKTQLQLTRGGPIVGDVATHYIPPTVAGFSDAGGMAGPGDDFDTNGAPNQAAVTKYMKLAGFPNGKYKGPKIFLVASSADPAIKTAQAFLNTLQGLGFNVNFKSVEASTMYTQFCNRPSSNYNICTNVGWLPDFPDASTVLDVTFNGEHIVPANNSNWPLLNDPAINSALDKANQVIDPAARAAAYGAIDKTITATAAAIPWFWDKQANIESKGVKGVIAKWNASYDFSFTSVK